MLDLLLTNASELTNDIRSGGCHVMVEFKLLSSITQVKSKIRKFNFRKANIQFLRELVNKALWKSGKTRELSRGGRFLRKPSLGHKNSPSPGV